MYHTLLAPVQCKNPEEHLGLPRVTSICDIRSKPELWEWKMRVGLIEAEKISKIATDLGTIVHTAIERFLAGQPYHLPEDYTVTIMDKPVVKSPKKLFQGFLNWYNTYQPTELYTEHHLCDHDLGYMGTTDLIAKIDGKWYIVDFKTSKRLDPVGMPLQLSAYAWAAEQMLGIKIEGRMIVRLTDKTKRGYQAKEYSDKLPVFLSHLDIWYYVEAHKKHKEDPNKDWDGGIIYGNVGSSEVSGSAEAEATSNEGVAA